MKPEAAQTLSALAEILGTDSGTNFELVVVGHTDDGSPSTTQQHPPTDTSPCTRHRGLQRTVMSAPTTASVAGWGEYRPLIPNETGGTAANRRVEIYLTTATAGDGGTMTTMTEDTMTTTATVDTDEPMK